MIRSKEELLAAIPALVGEEKTEADETIAFLEDIADTMDDLNGQIAEDWKGKYSEMETKYNENEAAWKKRYTERFLKGEETEEKKEEEKKDPDPDEPQPTEDLFKKE